MRIILTELAVAFAVSSLLSFTNGRPASGEDELRLVDDFAFNHSIIKVSGVHQIFNSSTSALNPSNSSLALRQSPSPLHRRQSPSPEWLRILTLGASIVAGFGSTPQDGFRKPLRDHLRSLGYKVNMVGSL